MGARKAHHARVTIQSGEDESEVCEPQTANKFLRDWAFLWISFPIFFSSYPNHSCGSKLPHCCTKQNVLVHTTCAIRFDSVHLARHQKRRRCVASSSLRSLADSQSDCKSFMFVMTWSKQQKRLLKGNVVTVCYSMLPYIIVCYTMLHHVCIVFFSFAFVSGSNEGHINQSFHSRPAAGMGRHTSQTSIRVSAFMSFP